MKPPNGLVQVFRFILRHDKVSHRDISSKFSISAQFAAPDRRKIRLIKINTLIPTDKTNIVLNVSAGCFIVVANYERSLRPQTRCINCLKTPRNFHDALIIALAVEIFLLWRLIIELKHGLIMPGVILRFFDTNGQMGGTVTARKTRYKIGSSTDP